MRNGYIMSTGVGNIAAGEVDYLWTPTNRRPLSKYGVVLCHSANNTDEFESLFNPKATELAAQLAMAGIPCVSPSTNGNRWANDTNMTNITNSITYLAARTGVPSTKVCLVGVSMGGAAATRYAILNPTKVAALVGIIPLTNLTGLYNANVIGAGPEIGVQWGVTYPAALPAAANIQSMASSLTMPAKYYYSSTDAIITPSDTTAFAAAAPNATATNVGTNGHSDASIGDVGNLSTGNFSAIIDFFKTNGA